MSLKILQTHVIYAAVCASDRYSASVEDRATVHFFLALQLIRLLLCSNTHNIHWLNANHKHSQPSQHQKMQ